MMDGLKELNIHDSRDFFEENSTDKSKPFEIEKCTVPPEYHLDSSHSDVKDQLRAYHG